MSAPGGIRVRVLQHTSAVPGAFVSAAKCAFFIAGFDRRRAMVRIFDSIIAWCDVGPPDSDTLVSAFVCYSSGSSIVTVGLQLDSLF